MEHDQRLKNLLQEFLGDLLRLAVPTWAGRFLFPAADWLQQEVFPDPPRGKSWRIDLVARVPVNEALEGVRPDEPAVHQTLVHIEIEFRDSVTDLRYRIPRYNGFLEHRHGLPVLSLALYLRVGLAGVGWDKSESNYWGRRQSQFEYPYVGLPALDAFQHVQGDNLLAIALVGLMRSPLQRRAELKAEAMQRVATAGVTEYRRHLLLECVDAYLPLEEPHLAAFQELLRTPKYREADKMVQTTFERGVEQGIELGHRALLRRLLEKRFGPLTEAVLKKLSSLTPEKLLEVSDALFAAQSLQELSLVDAPPPGDQPGPSAG